MPPSDPTAGLAAPDPAAETAAEPASPRERRRAQRLESRRREIVTVAEELFATHGFDGTSLAMIAEGTGYSVGGVYNFFPSKDAVYDAVVARRGVEMAERLFACMSTPGTGMDKLWAMAQRAILSLREFPRQARLTVRHMLPMHDDPDSRANLRATLDAYAQAIVVGQRDGTVRAGNPRHLAQYVGGLVLAQAQVDPEIVGDPGGVPLEEFEDIVRRALGPT
jgi:AcrR family transcriptional regulator